MKASARLEARGDRWTALRSDPPLAVRCRGPLAHLVGSAAGPLGGDRLDVHVSSLDGADVTVRSVAAQLVLPGPLGDRSTMVVRAGVGPASRLVWEPQPMVIVAGAAHDTRAEVSLAGDARLSWREEVVLGRFDEPPGSVRTRLRVELDGVPLVHHELHAGPRTGPGWDGPAGTGGRRALGTIVVVEPVRWRDGPPDAIDLGDGATALPADGPAVVVVALGDPPDVSAALDRACATLMAPSVAGRPLLGATCG